jgi:hypothetical protein
MNFDMIHAWRQSGLFQKYQSRGLGSNQGASSSDSGLNGIGPDKPTGDRGAFGSAFKISISSLGAQLGAEASEPELSEEQLKQIGERIASLRKANEEANQGKGPSPPAADA